MWIIYLAIGILIISALIVVLVLVSSKTKGEELTKRDKEEIELVGKVGEDYVVKYLSALAKKYNGYLFNSFCFQDYRGYSTEIDHILITRGGFFVIETKTNKGTVYGRTEDDKWVCKKKEYQDDKVFKNPILQNQGHIRHLQRMWHKDAPDMISIIIFPIANISHVKSDIVFDINGAIKYIKDKSEKAIYTQSRINKFSKKIIFIQKRFGISKEQHIENIRKKYK